MRPIRNWQWPNLLALDATLIALAWQEILARSQDTTLHIAPRLVLGLSIWLTYMADRLFDVAHRPSHQLHSLRHHYSKQHFKTLWAIWGSILLLNLFIAFNYLNSIQLRNGGILLALCLLYTTLNQRLSRHWFPKEVCVAIIYVGGIIIFLPVQSLRFASLALSLICLINCLMISLKEQHIDRAMQVRSLTHLPSVPMTTLNLITALSICWLNTTLAIPMLLSFLGLLLLQLKQKTIEVEAYRVLADTTLLLVPLIALLITP